MNYKTEYKNLLTVIIDDLRVCISYTPNQDNDLLCFMEQYIKAESHARPSILNEIRNCMDGKDYKNPFIAYQYYDNGEIEALENILKVYICDMHSGENKEKVLANTIVSVNELQEKSYGHLIDNWRNDHLTEFLVLVAKEVSYSSALAVIESKKLW
ncbi:MAG: hypothetical protein GX299_06855 [Epulopiscium sp.]|nr:hypothetical protein [Candidatus Epulonipiscium sp.]